MKSVILFLFGMAFIVNLAAQDCDCLSQFSFVKTYYENNNPAFQKLKNDPAEFSNYEEQVKKLTRKIGKEKSNDRCRIYFEKYITLLKDHHSGIDYNISRLPVDLTSRQSLDSFKSTPSYKAFKKIKIDSASLVAALNTKPGNSIEGLYTNGGSLLIGIMQSGKNHYKGVVIKKTSLLDPGHILLEFKKHGNATYDCIYHTGLLALNFQNLYQEIKVADGKIPEFGFSKLGPESNRHSIPYEFRSLDSSTNYLRLTSFNRNLKAELDSFYQSVSAVIRQTPKLIIDLRNNGGGSEECYYELVKYFYTRPLKIDRAEVWVTPEIIRKYNESGYSPDLVGRMSMANTSTFIPQTSGSPGTWEMEGTRYPERVVFLFNRGTASAAEGMILYGMQSSKVITMGVNSGGYLGYGDVVAETIPCGKYSLRTTTTMYRDKSTYEFTGISPAIRLNENEDWIEAARKQLDKK